MTQQSHWKAYTGEEVEISAPEQSGPMGDTHDIQIRAREKVGSREEA